MEAKIKYSTLGSDKTTEYATTEATFARIEAILAGHLDAVIPVSYVGAYEISQDDPDVLHCITEHAKGLWIAQRGKSHYDCGDTLLAEFVYPLATMPLPVPVALRAMRTSHEIAGSCALAAIGLANDL